MTTPSGPITLTPAQYGKTAAAAKPGATYAKYQSWLAARRPAPAPPDPYTSIIAGLPKPQTQGQISTEAQGEISPIVQAIIAAITKQTQGATSAISGYSNDAASKLAGINYGQPYQQGEGAQAAVDATLASSLAGQGTADANSLQSRLAVINDPSVAAAAANVQGNATGAANADTAQGSAALTNLIANAAAANSYGQKLPGIQHEAGLQDIAGVQQTGQANIASGTQAAEQQLPSILQSLQSENDNRSSAIASAQQNQLARNDNIAAGTAANTVKVQTVNANNATKVQIAQMNQAGKVTAEQATQARSDRTYRLQYTRTFGYDPVTGKVAPGFKAQGGNVVKVGTVKAPNTATLKVWSTTADDLYNGVAPKTHYDAATKTFVPVPGTGSPPAKWGAAIKQLMAKGATKEQAVQQLDDIGWQPGEGGRPLSKQQISEKKGVAAGKKVTAPLTNAGWAATGGR